MPIVLGLAQTPDIDIIYVALLKFVSAGATMVLRIERVHNAAGLLTKSVSAKVLNALKPITGIHSPTIEHAQRVCDIQVPHYPSCMWDSGVMGIVEVSGYLCEEGEYVVYSIRLQVYDPRTN